MFWQAMSVGYCSSTSLQASAIGNEAFKARFQADTGLARIYNFYGMVEQVGSVFLEGEDGLLYAPNFHQFHPAYPFQYTEVTLGRDPQNGVSIPEQAVSRLHARIQRHTSPGGDVFDGYAMYHALRAHPATVECVVEGLAASAASFVALAGETLVMSDPSMLMIHRAWTFAMGNVNDMNAVAARLSKVDGQIADLYAAKTGKPAADMLALMDAETWMTAKEAAELGFVDEIDDPEEDADADAKAQASVHTARLRAARLVELGIR